jgi:PiT family inorganic phosphate transporter
VAGFNDGGNLLAAAVSSRTIAPGISYVLIVASACAGPLIVGTAVARTIGTGIADFRAIGPGTLVAAIAGALASVSGAYAGRVPTSMSVALFSSMIGALWAGPGLAAVHWSGVEKVAASMAASIIVGLLGGALAYVVILCILIFVRRQTAERIVSLQYVTVALLAFGYGSNDLEKTAGLLAAGIPSATFGVPIWTIAVAAAFFAAGMAIGGVRVAKTVGGKLFSIRPHHALAFQLASALTVIGAAHFGGPLSTTETSASAIVGVGAASNPRAVRWHVVRHIVLSWVITIPTALAAGALAEVFIRFHP